MDYFRFLNNPPVIVCGNPRSGTRMCANVLNAHSDVLITGEWHNVSKLNRMVSRFSEYLPDRITNELKQEKSDAMVHMMWALRDTATDMDKLAKAAYVGNKTPTVEHHFDKFEQLFGQKPIYVYCVRNAFSVLRSVKNLKNLAWNKNSVEKNLSLYLSSLKKYQEMLRLAPGRVHLVKLDELKSHENNMSYYRFLFDALNLSVDETLERRVNRLGKQNSMEKVKSKNNVDESTVVELTEDEFQLILGSLEYRRLARELSIPDPNLASINGAK